jgi:transcription-repair coupling factor (superfamily II helicase)
MSILWELTLDAAPELRSWVSAGAGELRVSRLPRPAWPIVAGAVARGFAGAGRSMLILAPAPDRFCDELRPWLAGNPPTHVFAEVAISFLDRPPAYDEAVNKRMEALNALTDRATPSIVVSSRRAITRATISPADLVQGTLVLAPGGGPDPVAAAGRLVEMGYSREPLVEEHGQFSLRGGILDVFPAAADSPVRAEWAGDVIETLRLFDPENQRSVMGVSRVAIHPGRELLIGPRRGAAAANRLREGVPLDALRADVRADWEEELERLEAGATFPGVEFYSAYLDPSLPSLLDHIPEGMVIIDFEPGRQEADALVLVEETEMLAAAEAGGAELPRGFALPVVGAERLQILHRHPRLELTAGEGREGAVDLAWTEAEPLVGRPRAAADLAAHAVSATVAIATEQSERLKAFLDEARIHEPLREIPLDLDLELEPGLHHADIDIAAGCVHPAFGFHLVTDAELFGRLRRPARPTRSSRGRAEQLTREFTLDFAPGELVVHVDHGIARFAGMRLLESEGAHREYLELEYAEADKLFVPVENLDRVQKYLGGEGEPSLHRLGTGEVAGARARPQGRPGRG